MDDDAVKPADDDEPTGKHAQKPEEAASEGESGKPDSAIRDSEPLDDTKVLKAEEPPRRSAPPQEDTPPWDSPGRPRNAVIGILLTVALLGAAGLIGWAMLRPSIEDGSTGAVSDPSGPCELRTVDEMPGDGGVPAVEGIPERSTAVLTTNLGQVTVMLFGDLAPCGVASFTHLSRQGSYNSATCPSMTSALTEPTLILRCGIPTDQGGPGYRVRGEHPFADTAVVDALALVNDADGRSGAEFALIRGQSVPTNNLTVIGQVIDGFGVLDSITAQGGAASYAGPPPMPVTVLTVTVLGGPPGPSSSSGSGLPGLPSGPR
ncbi:peptidylprolyl isomerase [Phytomonospora sp. NPDC050363]|uniref:peptidylprolyl isomerase n=1 Tax=Phytomonospora sp. NPDC050363 TaxID=3155642 RepID=UPI0033D4FB71